MIQTKYHGEIEITDNDMIQFEKGIPGFLDEKRFVMIPLSDDQTFSILQSVQTPYVAFVIASPFHFFPDYEFNSKI
jgi:flagellar assembly factor FliW